jgi:GT2 family glycosyltransferase
MFWRLRPFDDDIANHQPPTTWPTVIAIVPARNEATTIAQSITSLLQQNYPGQFSIILVDDHSEDATALRAQQAAADLSAESRMQILPAPPLAEGWTGKLAALNEGVTRSTSTLVYPDAQKLYPEPRSACAPTSSISLARPITSGATTPDPATEHAPPMYYWFTDADITHAPNTLQRLVARAEKNQLNLTSLMVQLQAKNLSERALIPAFLFFFLKLYPPQWTADRHRRTAGAAGGCILLRAEALKKIGGLAAIRSEVIDDCALAAAVKRTGGKIWMGSTRESISLRHYTTFREIQDMIARTAFTQLRYNPLLLLGTVAGMSLIYLAPIALLAAHHNAARILAAITWLVMALLYLPTIRFYRLSPLWAATLPAAALFYTYSTVLSGIRFYQGRGAQWKGRNQAGSR